MSKNTTLGELNPGNWFRFPNDKQRYIVIAPNAFVIKSKSADKTCCVNLSCGNIFFTVNESIVHRIKKP